MEIITSQKAVAFGKNLKHIRKTLGLTHEEVAKRSGIAASTISHYETGRREPNVTGIVRLCKGLGCTPNVLIKVE